MEKVRLGTSDLMVSKICMGTMTFGEQNTPEQSQELLDYAVERGVNFVDVAEMYPVPVRAVTYGQSEIIVGQWLKKQQRDKIVLATKVAGPSRGMDWIRGGRGDLSANDVKLACEASLKRLGVDYIDLYQIHWPARNVPMFGKLYFDPRFDHPSVSLQEQLQGVDRLVREGKVRAIGLSNESPYGLMSFLQLADQRGLARVASVQNCFNLLNRSVQDGLDEVLHYSNVSLLAYSPLAFGRLSGKYEEGGKGRLTLFSANWSPRYMRPEVIKAVAQYKKLATERKLSLTKMSLAYCYQHWAVSSTIIGATTLEQLKENLDAQEVTIDNELSKAIDAVRFAHHDPAK